MLIYIIEFMQPALLHALTAHHLPFLCGRHIRMIPYVILLPFRLEVCLAVEAHVFQLGGGFDGVVGEGEAVGVRHGLEGGLPEVGPLGRYHRLQSGPVAMGLREEADGLNQIHVMTFRSPGKPSGGKPWHGSFYDVSTVKPKLKVCQT